LKSNREDAVAELKVTEEQKIAALAEFEQLPKDVNRNAWVREHVGIAAPNFYKWRKKHLAKEQPVVKLAGPVHKISKQGMERIKQAQREHWARQKAAGKKHRVEGRDSFFHRATREEKLRLVREHDALPPGETRRAWKLKHLGEEVESSGLLTYYRNQFKKEGLYDQQQAPSKALVPARTNKAAQEAALVAEYDSLGKVPKTPWLKEHGLNYSRMFNMRARVGRNNGVQPVMAHVLPEAAPGPTVTLEDACNAMQVRIDIYNEVLDHFRRMLKGGR